MAFGMYMGRKHKKAPVYGASVNRGFFVRDVYLAIEAVLLLCV